MFFWVGHFDFFFSKIFFCFFPMKISQSLLVSKDGSKFWSSQTWQHFLTHAKHFEGECMWPRKITGLLCFVLETSFQSICFYRNKYVRTLSQLSRKNHYDWKMTGKSTYVLAASKTRRILRPPTPTALKWCPWCWRWAAVPSGGHIWPPNTIS